MSDIYTSFSNYNEINIENRKKSTEDEVISWSENAKEYLKYRQEWKKAAEENYTPEIPLHVDIELSDACNLRCSFCAHGMGTVKNVGFMDEEKAKELITEVSELGVKSIKFNWRGEVSINNFLPQAIKYAKDKNILEVQINTNGLPKEKDLLIKCAQNGLDRIIFSVDGFSESTYEEVRKGGHYKQLIENIKDLIKWKLDNDKVKPFVRIQMVRTNVNKHEVNDFLKFWQPKVDDVRISDVMDRGQGNKFSVGDQETVGRRRCPQPFQRLVIGRDGRVSPCCADWNQEVIIGDTAQESLLDIWNGKNMQDMRDIQNKNEHYKVSICDTCYVKESYIWQTIKK